MNAVWRVFAYLKRYPWMAAGTLTCAILSTVMVIIFPTVHVLIDGIEQFFTGEAAHFSQRMPPIASFLHRMLLLKHSTS